MSRTLAAIAAAIAVTIFSVSATAQPMVQSRSYCWDGSTWVPCSYASTSGTLSTVVQAITNRAVAANTADSASVAFPFREAGYTKATAMFHFRVAASGASVNVAVRGHTSASVDSAATWYYTMGGGERRGKTLTWLSGPDRLTLFSFAVAETLTNIPITAPYLSHYVKNASGQPLTYDLWFYLEK